ncbi:transferrin-binding protein-like solute binding protein [Xanthomonas sp. Kuri4-1]
MNLKHTRTAAVLGVALAGLLGSAHAAPFVGKSSNESYVKVGVSTVNGGPHRAGLAGVAVNSTGLNNPVDFNGLSSYGGTGAVKVLNFPYSGAPNSHDSLGVFAFAQVGSQDVWFGEWYSRKDTTDGQGTHTVYFMGDRADTSVPTSGTASYAVVGLNNYSAGNQLTGTFNANFGTGRLTGSIQNAAGFAVNIGTATINGNASISGSNAIARQSGTVVATDGAVSGQFYANQTALAGIADFAGVQHDTAFGGAKQ